MIPMAATIILRFADQGWHVRWRAFDTEEFERTLAAFKDLLERRDRYWDPMAFEEKGGWWVAYGALAAVAPLFENYQKARDQLERPFRQQFEQQLAEARARASQYAEAERQRQQQETARQERQREQEEEEQRKRRREQRQQHTSQEPRKAPGREQVVLPRTVEEAISLLRLTAPFTAKEVRRAYRARAFHAHPDRGGSHGEMVVLNAAYELALAAC
jgi:hypothetical protein